MKPRLIVLNGPLGIGKSTLARRYAEAHPLTLFLDIDDVWAMLSHWREEKEVSTPLSKRIAVEMARVMLRAGHDVVIPQIIQSTELAVSFENLAASCDARYFEILLLVEKEEAIRRFIERGRSEGHPTGFRAGGIIDRSGREKKLSAMYDNMIAVAEARPQVITIMPIRGAIEQTYVDLMSKIQ